MSEISNAEKLRREVAASAALSFPEAERRLPDLAMAELSGEDVSVAFQDVLDAIGRYPRLADAYEKLLDGMEALLDAPSARQPAARNPWLSSSPARLTDRYTLRMVGQEPGGFLLQCLQPPPAQARVARGGIELAHVIMPELPGAPELLVALESRPDGGWQLAVAVRTLDGGQSWRVTALVDGVTLAALEEQAGGAQRFAALPAYPTAPIVLFFAPGAGGEEAPS